MRTEAARAAAASRAIEPGTSSARAMHALDQASNSSSVIPQRCTMIARFCGRVRLAAIEFMWSLKASRSIRPSCSQPAISASASRL